MLAFFAALALDYKKLLAYARFEHPFRLPFRSHTRPVMTDVQYEDRIAIRDPYDLFDTIHSQPPVRIHQPIHVIGVVTTMVLAPEHHGDAQDLHYRIPFDGLSERTVIFADQRTVIKTTKSVILELRRDAMCIAVLATRDATMRIFIYDTCDDAMLFKVTSIYRHADGPDASSIHLDNATLYLVK